MSKHKFEICVSVHNFEKRFCWAMSSFLQQRDFNLSKLLINIGYIKDTGVPKTEEVIDFFSSAGLQTKKTCYDNREVFQFRGKVRNEQLQDSNSDWLVYIDCDGVFSPDFFSILDKRVEIIDDKCKCFYCARRSTGVPEGNSIIENIDVYPTIIERAYEKVNKTQLYYERNIGAGYFQMIGRKELMKKFGHYVRPQNCRDYQWENGGSRCRSDMQFRKMVGKVKLDLPQIIHIDHIRDKEFAKHIEDSR